MEIESKEGRVTGGENPTNYTKEGENTRTADNEKAEKCGVEQDTGNGVAPNVDDGIETDSCQGPEAVSRAKTTSEKPSGTVSSGNGSVQLKKDPEFQEKTRGEDTKAAVSGAKTTSEKPSEKVHSGSDSAQPKVESQLPENTRGEDTKSGEEVKGPIDEAQNATKDNNISQGKTEQTYASKSEEQSDPDSSQAAPGTDQVETSRTVQYQDDGPPQTAADSPSELAGNKGIKEPNDKTPDAPTAQSIKRNNMEDSSSNGTQKPLPGSGGIPDNKLEKLAKALPGEEYRNTRSLGQNLGFSLTQVYGYCGYGGKPKDSTGILRMLRDWKKNTPDAKQISGLLEALKKANLKHLADDFHSQHGAEEQRGAVQTSDGDSVTSPSKSVQPTTTRSDPLTDNSKSSPSVVPGAGPDPNTEDAPPKGYEQTYEEERGGPKITDSSSELKETNPKTVVSVAGPGTDTKGAPGNYSGQTDKEEKGYPQKSDSSSKPNGTNSKKVESVAGPGTATKGAPGNYSGQTDKEEKGDPQKTDPSSKPKGTYSKKVVPVAGPGTDTKGAPGDYSGQTDKEEKGDPQKTDSSPKSKGTNSKKVESVAGPGTATKGAPGNYSGQTDKEEKGDPQKTDSSPKPKGTNSKKVELEARLTVGDLIKERPVSISVCTSAYDFNVQGLVSFLKYLMDVHPELIKEVKFHELPYNDLDHYEFPKENPVDVMLLCHSINNRRFAITDVMDALYDEYLPYCAKVVGKNKMGVIVHDFEDMNEAVHSSRMSSFKYKQPKAFETTSLQIICGHIEKEEVLNQMLKADREKVLEFLKNASTFPEQIMEQVTESQSLLKKGTDRIVTSYKKGASSCKQAVKSLLESVTPGGGSQPSTSKGSSVDPSKAERNDHGLTKKATFCGSHQTTQASVDERKLNPPSDASLIKQRIPGTSIAPAAAHTQGSPRQQTMTYSSGGTVTSALQMSSPRRISISVCSSAYEHNVKGFMSKLTEFQAGQPLMTDIHFRNLPYNDIDSFRFPSKDPVDVMVLCHSVQNRGFSITNVMNALYEKYLQYCHDVIGKKKLAVIVHDFSDCKPKTLDVRMESFKRSQPLTFELVDTVIVCGNLEKPGKIEMRDEDITRLTTFIEEARYEQRENYAVKQSFYKKSYLGSLW